MERKKNSTIEMSAARIATMMEESGGGEAGGDVPLVKVSRALCIVYCRRYSVVKARAL